MMLQLFDEVDAQEIPTLTSSSLHLWIQKNDADSNGKLRHLLTRYIKRPILKKSALGKPYLFESLIQFNVSHSQNIWACVLGWQVSVGVDIEVIRPIARMNDLITDYFSLREQAYIQGNVTHFWQLWNRKEACLKALGVGLQKNMRSWDCLGNSALTEWAELPCSVWIRSFPINGYYTGAVAYKLRTS